MTKDSSKRFVEASLQRAERALNSAKLLLKHGQLEDAVSRAYYAEKFVGKVKELLKRPIT